MDINDLTKGLDKNKLNDALKQLSGVIPKEQMNQAMNTLKNTNQNDLKQQLGKIDTSKLSQIISNNAGLKKAISSNPDIMNNLNSILNNKGK